MISRRICCDAGCISKICQMQTNEFPSGCVWLFQFAECAAMQRARSSFPKIYKTQNQPVFDFPNFLQNQPYLIFPICFSITGCVCVVIQYLHLKVAFRQNPIFFRFPSLDVFVLVCLISISWCVCVVHPQVGSFVRCRGRLLING